MREEHLPQELPCWSPGRGWAPEGCLNWNTHAMCGSDHPSSNAEGKETVQESPGHRRSARTPARTRQLLANFACWGKSSDLELPRESTMAYVTAGSPGTLSDHLVKPPETEDDAPQNVIPWTGEWGARARGSRAGLGWAPMRGTSWLCRKFTENKALLFLPSLAGQSRGRRECAFAGLDARPPPRPDGADKACCWGHSR